MKKHALNHIFKQWRPRNEVTKATSNSKQSSQKNSRVGFQISSQYSWYKLTCFAIYKKPNERCNATPNAFLCVTKPQCKYGSLTVVLEVWEWTINCRFGYGRVFHLSYQLHEEKPDFVKSSLVKKANSYTHQHRTRWLVAKMYSDYDSSRQGR